MAPIAFGNLGVTPGAHLVADIFHFRANVAVRRGEGDAGIFVGRDGRRGRRPVTATGRKKDGDEET
jgi:hypothetical protein